MATKQTRTTRASSPETVDAYMQVLQHPLHMVAAELRKLILNANDAIGEDIAWNAPAFFYTGHMLPFNPKEYKRYIVVFNLHRKDCVRLIFLRGADVSDTSGLLEGDYKDGRRIALFYNPEDVQKRKKDLEKVIRQLLKQIKDNQK